MRNQKSEKPNRTQLAEIKKELSALDPQFKKLKVRHYYSKGRIVAHAHLGKRRLHVYGTLKDVVARFTDQYLERLPTAF